MRVIIACAGSGGHVNPGIAIANIIKKREPESEILFIGTKTGLENDLVKKAGYEIKTIKSGRLHRRLTLENVKNVYNAYIGIYDTKKILKEYRPDLVIGTGGYICVSVMFAAKKMHIPYILHESNVYPGLSVKLNAKHAAKVLLGFDETKKYLPDANCIYTGTPAKFNEIGIDCLNKSHCKNELGLKSKNVLFVTGGSQGAKRINDTIITMIKKYKPKNFFTVIAVGHGNYEQVLKEIGDEYSEYIKVEKYIYDMEKMYKAADLLITRAGAMTVLELEIAAKPAILIPLPTAAENHQLYNAKILEAAKSGIVIEEKDLNEDKLYSIIDEHISNKILLKEMGENARKLVVENVEDKIYEEIKNTNNQLKKV